MRVERIALSNFKSYQDLDLDLSSVSLASVVGPNGAGKSTILEAITYALYGSDGARNLDTYIRKGMEECRVALTFSVGGLRYRLTRTYSNRNKGKSTLELCREEGELWVAEGTQVRETDQRIEAILAVDQATLRLTSVISQEDAGSFFKLPVAQRLEGIGRILRLDQVYEPIRGYMKDHADQNRVDLDLARKDAERLEADAEKLAMLQVDHDMAMMDVGETKGRLADAEQAFSGAQQALDGAKEAAAGTEAKQARADQLHNSMLGLLQTRDRLVGEDNTLVERTSRRDELQGRLSDKGMIEETIAGFEFCREYDRETDQRREALTSELRAEKTAAIEIATRGQKLKTAIDQEQARLDAVLIKIDSIERAERPICDRCGQTIADKALLQTLQQLGQETTELGKHLYDAGVERDELRTRYEEHAAKVKDLQAQIDALPVPTFDVYAHQAATKALADLEAIPARLAAIDALSERLSACRAEQASINDQLGQPTFTDERLSLEAELRGAVQLERDVREARLQVEIRQATLDGCRGALSTAEKAAARLEGEIAALEDVPAKLEQAKADATIHARECADYDLLKTAFGKAGVPALIIQNVLLALETQVNELLSLYDGGLAIRFENEKTLQTGEARVSLEIMVFDGADWRAFETFSGGERYRVASAMRLGLARLLAHRSGARVETLLIDEPEGLDATGRAHLATILEHMSGDFGICLLLTHYEDLKDAMPQQIIVSRGEDGLSRAEVAA